MKALVQMNPQNLAILPNSSPERFEGYVSPPTTDKHKMLIQLNQTYLNGKITGP